MRFLFAFMDAPSIFSYSNLKVFPDIYEYYDLK